uniref:Uncharacterized protein n=1 Tax=Meloidogyne hapla TaxID=6305 RepID=A0A1I8B3J5_MELHA
MQSQTSGVASNVVGNNSSDHQQSPIETNMEPRPQTSETNFPNRRLPQAETTGNGNNFQIQQNSSNSVTEGGAGPCGGCVELRREVEELRQMLFQMQNESSAFSPTSAANRFRPQHPQQIQKPQSPPSPPHPSIPQPVHHQTFQSANQQLRQALLLQNQAAINSNSQGQAQQQFQHSGNANNYNSHVLQLFLSQASANQQQQTQHSQNLSHPPVPMSSASSSSTPAVTPATAPGVNRILEQLGQQLDIATLQAGSGSNPASAQQILTGAGAEKQQQQQLLVSTIQMLQQAAQIQQINGQSQQQGSGASTRNNSIQSGESVFYDPSSGMDVSETSSSASSTNAQIMLQTSPQLLLDSKPATLLQQLQQHQQQIVNVNQIQQQQHQQNQQQLNPNRNNQLDLINAAISRTNAAVASHLLSPSHGGEDVLQQQQQCTIILNNF